MTVLHLFDQPLTVTRPYEAYMGTLAVPAAVTRDRRGALDPRRPPHAARQARRGDRADRARHPPRAHPRLDARRQEPRDAPRAAVGRVARRSASTWSRTAGPAPAGCPRSPTRGPTPRPTSWAPGRTRRARLTSSSATATPPRPRRCRRRASPTALDVDVSMALYSPRFELPHGGRVPPDAARPRRARLRGAAGPAPGRGAPAADRVEYYRSCLREKSAANLPSARRVLRADDFFPEKSWRVLAATGYIGHDPYTGLPGVTRLEDGPTRSRPSSPTRRRALVVRFVFRLLEPFEQTRLVFSPLLERFIAGEDYRTRAVKVSDSGRHPQRAPDPVLAGPRVRRRRRSASTSTASTTR